MPLGQVGVHGGGEALVLLLHERSSWLWLVSRGGERLKGQRRGLIYNLQQCTCPALHHQKKKWLLVQGKTHETPKPKR